MRTLRARLLWRFFLITVPPLAVAAVIGGLLAAQQLRAERQDRLIAGAHGAELALKDIHDGIAVRAEAAARSPELLQAITEGDRQAVLDFAERSVALIGVDHVTVVGADGRVLARGHAPARYGDAYARPGELSAGTLQRQLGPGEGGFGIRIIAPLALAAPGGALVVERAVDHHTLRRLRAQFGLDFVAWDGDRLQATTLSSSAAVEGAAAARVILEQGAEVADSPELDFTYARLVSADAGDGRGGPPGRHPQHRERRAAAQPRDPLPAGHRGHERPRRERRGALRPGDHPPHRRALSRRSGRRAR